VIDLAQLDRSTFALPGGNSGIPGHRRYDDVLDDFLAGRQRPLLYTRPAVERHAEHHLVLTPAASTPEGEAAA
jgi:penicillin amidase